MATPKPMMEDILYSTQTLNLDQPKYQNRTVRHGEGDEVVSVVDMFLEEISTNADEIRRFFEEENLLHDLVCEVGFEYPDESDIGDHTSRAAFDLADRARGIEVS